MKMKQEHWMDQQWTTYKINLNFLNNKPHWRQKCALIRCSATCYFLVKNRPSYWALKIERKQMKMINRIFDLRISKRDKKHSSEIKKQISEIILFDRFEIKKESEKKTSPNGSEIASSDAFWFPPSRSPPGKPFAAMGLEGGFRCATTTPSLERGSLHQRQG